MCVFLLLFENNAAYSGQTFLFILCVMNFVLVYRVNFEQHSISVCDSAAFPHWLKNIPFSKYPKLSTVAEAYWKQHVALAQKIESYCNVVPSSEFPWYNIWS